MSNLRTFRAFAERACSREFTCSGIECGELVQAPVAAVHAAPGRIEGGGPHVVRVLGDPGAGPPVVRAAGLAGLAQAHLPHVGESEHLGRGPKQKKITETAKWLTRYCVSGNFDLDLALDALDQKLIPAEIVIDYCIPMAAEELGDDWVDDLKGFGQVTLATSRLQMILNNVINYQNSESEIESAHGLMLIVCKDEQHTLGPSILADQLRRRGHSVKFLHSANSKELITLCNDHMFSAVLFSCSGHHSIDYITKSIKIGRAHV